MLVFPVTRDRFGSGFSPVRVWYNDSRIEGPMSENSMAIGPCDELHVGNRRNEMFCDESLRQADDVVARY